MATDRVFGIGSVTCGDITGIIVGEATITGDTGETKKLTGNPCTTIVETRMSTPYVRKMSLTGAYEAVTGLDQALLGTEVTLTVGSDTTNLGLGGTAPSDTITLEGIVTEFDIKINKDDWAVASLTVEKKGPDPVA